MRQWCKRCKWCEWCRIGNGSSYFARLCRSSRFERFRSHSTSGVVYGHPLTQSSGENVVVARFMAKILLVDENIPRGDKPVFRWNPDFIGLSALFKSTPDAIDRMSIELFVLLGWDVYMTS